MKKPQKSGLAHLDNQQNNISLHHPSHSKQLSQSSGLDLAQCEKLTGWDDEKPLIEHNLNTFCQRLNKLKQNKESRKNKILNYISQNKNKSSYSRKNVRSSVKGARTGNGGNCSVISQKNIQLSIKAHIQNSIQNGLNGNENGENCGSSCKINNNINGPNVSNKIPYNPIHSYSNHSYLQAQTQNYPNNNSNNNNSYSQTYMYNYNNACQLSQHQPLSIISSNCVSQNGQYNSYNPTHSAHTNQQQLLPHKCEYSNIELLKFQAKHLENDQVSNNRLPTFNFNINFVNSTTNAGSGGNSGHKHYHCGIQPNKSELISSNYSQLTSNICGYNNCANPNATTSSNNNNNKCSCNSNLNNLINIDNLQQCQSTQINIYEISRKLRTQSTKRNKCRKEKNYSQLNNSINNVGSSGSGIHHNCSNHNHNHSTSAACAHQHPTNRFYKTLTNQWNMAQISSNNYTSTEPKSKNNINLIVEPSSSCSKSSSFNGNGEMCGGNGNNLNGFGFGIGESNLIGSCAGVNNYNNSNNNKVQLDFSSLLAPHPQNSNQQEYKTIHWKKSKPFTKFFQGKRNLHRNKSASSSAAGTAGENPSASINSINNYLTNNSNNSVGNIMSNMNANLKNCLKQIQGRKLQQLLTLNRQVIELDEF